MRSQSWIAEWIGDGFGYWSKKTKLRRSFLFLCLFVAFGAIVALLFFDTWPEIFAGRAICDDGGVPARVSIVGDLLIGSGRVWRQIVDDDYGVSIIGDYFDTFKQSDLTLANFEGIISAEGELREKGLPSSFSLRTDPEILKFLAKFPQIILSFANNHSADAGLVGIEGAIQSLDGVGVEHVGIGKNNGEALAPRIIEINGIRIAFLAFTDLLPEEYFATDAKGGVAKLSPENLGTAIKKAREISDFIIVSIHSAASINSALRRTPDEHQRFFSRLAVGEGADVVIGQQPHILQKAEKFGSGIIFYSLGAFLYDPAVSSRYAPDHPLFNGVQFKGGGILALEICRSGVQSFRVTPTKVTHRSGNLLVTGAALSTKLITRLNLLYLQLQNIRLGSLGVLL